MRVAAVGFSSASATVVATHNLASEANQVDYTVNFHIDAALVVKGSVGVSVAARHATCESCGGFGASGTLLVPGDYATTLTLRNSTGSAVPPGNIDLSVELIGSAAGDTIGISRPCTLQPHCVPQEIIRVPTPGYASGAGTLKSIVADAATTSPGENSSPQASFTHTCSELTCSFDASGSSDSDGSISSYRWDFGDGTTGSGVTASHSYASAGTYRATLTVTDDQGAASSTSQDVTVTEPTLTLSATGERKGNNGVVQLSWSGATVRDVDIYRNGAVVRTTANDGSETDRISKPSGSYAYKVCEAGTTTCSNEAIVTF